MAERERYLMKETTVDETPDYIDMTPTWAGIMPGLLDAWSNVIPENERIMREEFQRVALAADRYVLITKAYRTYREEGDPAAFAEALYAIIHGRV